jgi:hypothetical protein
VADFGYSVRRIGMDDGEGASRSKESNSEKSLRERPRQSPLGAFMEPL